MTIFDLLIIFIIKHIHELFEDFLIITVNAHIHLLVVLGQSFLFISI